MSSNKQFEHDFEDFLNEENSRVAALYRKLPRPEPDARLDAAVQAMVRRAQAEAPRIRARAPRWIPALGAAAIVTLAAGIAFRIGPTVWQEHHAPELQKSAAENAVSTPASAPNDAKEKRRSEGADALKDQGAPKPAPISAPGAAPPTSAAPPARGPSHKLETPAPRVDAPAPQAFPAPVQEQEKRPAASAGLAGGALDQSAPERKRDQDTQAASEKPALQTRNEGNSAAPVTVATPPPPPLREEPAPAQRELRSAPTTQAPAGSDAAAESTFAAPAAKAAHSAPVRSRDPNATLYPEHWLANIRTMLREGKSDEALRSLDEFRKMYPDYHLPDDLRDLK